MEPILFEKVEKDLSKLTKNQIGKLLTLTQKEIRSTKKGELLSRLLAKVNGNNLLIKRIYQQFPDEFGAHPSTVEMDLNITKTERLRWTEQKKLKVIRYSSFNKWGSTHLYPVYDAYQLKTLSQVKIEKWRAQHKRRVEQNRKKAARKAIETRKQNQILQRAFYENEWKSMLKQWYILDGKLGSTLQLAYWTTWISRWAKEYQLKARNARTKKGQYEEKKRLFYEMKNDSLQRLILSPFSSTSFYQPTYPDKITYLQFCPHHYDMWCIEREFDYISKWDFYKSEQSEINECPECTVEIEKDYYSLFYIVIQSELLKEFRFSFHTPYSIGQPFLPPVTSLPQVSHQEREGLFRFGRTLIEDEKIIFTEKEVLKNFKKAMQKFELYFS
ncbi:hypothetical protein [Pseudalkalibacillus decolorationis]|uniref:hypothetical protein n=1 Tax=Pseudalkalibacillus decolorationis TaxID=163879 RepID=UPI002148D20C|nr:hypothetical protein [Pseudalkalibacillus decolorationis]